MNSKIADIQTKNEESRITSVLNLHYLKLILRKRNYTTVNKILVHIQNKNEDEILKKGIFLKRGKEY